MYYLSVWALVGGLEGAPSKNRKFLSGCSKDPGRSAEPQQIHVSDENVMQQQTFRSENSKRGSENDTSAAFCIRIHAKVNLAAQ